MKLCFATDETAVLHETYTQTSTDFLSPTWCLRLKGYDPILLKPHDGNSQRWDTTWSERNLNWGPGTLVLQSSFNRRDAAQAFIECSHQYVRCCGYLIDPFDVPFCASTRPTHVAVSPPPAVLFQDKGTPEMANPSLAVS